LDTAVGVNFERVRALANVGEVGWVLKKTDTVDWLSRRIQVEGINVCRFWAKVNWETSATSALSSGEGVDGGAVECWSSWTPVDVDSEEGQRWA
jgi:hypothetical protein